MAIGITHSFPMHRGDDRKLTYVVVDQQSPAVVVDITGALIEYAFALQDATASEPQPKAASTVFTKGTVAGGITITDAVNGAFEVIIDSADTVGLKAPLDYYHEIQITLGALVTTLSRGIVTLKREIVAPGA